MRLEGVIARTDTANRDLAAALNGAATSERLEAETLRQLQALGYVD